MQTICTKFSHLKVHGFGEKIYANGGLVGVVKAVVHKPKKESVYDWECAVSKAIVPCDKAGFANTLLSQEDQLELPEQLNMIFRKLDEKIWIFQVWILQLLFLSLEQ